MSTAWQDFWAGLAIWFAAAAACVLIAACAVDSHGRKPWHHPGPVPEHVLKLGGANYVILNSSPLTPTDLCKDSGKVNPVEEAAKISRLDGALYARCSRDQSWNDHRAASINYGHSLGRVMSNLYVIFGLVLSLVLLQIPTFVSYLEGRRRRRAVSERNQINDERKRTELARAFSRNELTEAEWERGLAKIDNPDLL